MFLFVFFKLTKTFVGHLFDNSIGATGQPPDRGNEGYQRDLAECKTGPKKKSILEKKCVFSSG